MDYAYNCFSLMNCNGHIINDKQSGRAGAKVTISQMELIMRLMIAVFNRPNGNLLINIQSENVLQNSCQSLGVCNSWSDTLALAAHDMWIF